jgi:hypothetical protein
LLSGESVDPQETAAAEPTIAERRITHALALFAPSLQ